MPDKSLRQQNWHCFQISVDTINKIGAQGPPNVLLPSEPLSLANVILHNDIKAKSSKYHLQGKHCSMVILLSSSRRMQVSRRVQRHGLWDSLWKIEVKKVPFSNEKWWQFFGRWDSLWKISKKIVDENQLWELNYNACLHFAKCSDLGSVALTSAPAHWPTHTGAIQWQGSASAIR